MLKTWIKLAGKIITIFSILFIGIAIARLDIDLSYIKSPFIFAFIFIISSIAIMGAEYILGYAWKKTLDTFSNRANSIIATEKVYLKAGFKREGVLRDAIMDGDTYADDILMSILEDEWRTLKMQR